jgi:hypothetical protein
MLTIRLIAKVPHTIDGQRNFLIRLSQEFQIICKDAMEGFYDDQFFKENVDEKLLSTNVINKHTKFGVEFRQNGAFWNITDESGEGRDHAIKAVCVIMKQICGPKV